MPRGDHDPHRPQVWSQDREVGVVAGADLPFTLAPSKGHSKDAAVPRDVAESGYSDEETDRLQLKGDGFSRPEARQRVTFQGVTAKPGFSVRVR